MRKVNIKTPHDDREGHGGGPVLGLGTIVQDIETREHIAKVWRIIIDPIEYDKPIIATVEIMHPQLDIISEINDKLSIDDMGGV